jgi:predicted transcriptional regulator
MPSSDLPETEQILDFVELCRDEHVAPYPVGIRVISEFTGLSMHRVRFGTDRLLSEGRLTKMAAYPDHGVVLP